MRTPVPHGPPTTNPFREANTGGNITPLLPCFQNPIKVSLPSNCTTLQWPLRRLPSQSQTLGDNGRLHHNDNPLGGRDVHVRERSEGGFTNLGVSQILDSDNNTYSGKYVMKI